MIYDITITITGVETADLYKLEELCEMMAEVCNTLCNKCDFRTVKRFDYADYELKEVDE